MVGKVAIVGAGQIGFATARAFLADGWDVRVLARTAPQWSLEGAQFARYVAGEDRAPSADLVLDTIAFDAEDVARYDEGGVGRLVVVSSASVYRDDQGRTLDEAGQNGFPEFDGPIAETQATVAPGPETYSTRKIRMEQRATEAFGQRATILRPCAIHGPWSRHPREWWFVKRLLDARTRIPLGFEGQSRFQTTAVASIAEFAVHAARGELGGVFNIADADAPRLLEIGQWIANHLEREVEFALIEEPVGTVGRTPWSVPRPFLIAGDKARQAGYAGAAPYGEHAGEAVDWLVEANPEDWRATFKQLGSYPIDLFDYDAEDSFFAAGN